MAVDVVKMSYTLQVSVVTEITFIMPVVFRAQGYAFFFYSNEGNPREATHVHVRKGSAVAKFWLYPEVCLAESYGLNGQEQGLLAGIVVERQREIEEAWHEFFG